MACAAAEACRELIAGGVSVAEAESRLAPVWALLPVARMPAPAQGLAWDVPVDWVRGLAEPEPSGRSVLTTLASEPWASRLRQAGASSPSKKKHSREF